MAVRIVFSDVDGTLVDAASSCHADVAGPVFRRARSEGVVVALLSGRPPAGIRRVQGELGIDGPMAACSGALVLDAAGGVVESRLIPLDVAGPLYELLRDDGTLGVSATAFDRWVTADERLIDVRAIVADVGIAPRPARDLSAFADLGGVHKLMLTGPLERLVAMERVLWERHPQLTVVRSDDHSLEIMAGGVSKAGAVRTLCSRLGVDVADAVAFGDSLNDVEMLCAVPESYAMPNGEAPAKEAAAHVAAWGNDEEGVARTLAWLLWGERLEAAPSDGAAGPDAS